MTKLLFTQQYSRWFNRLYLLIACTSVLVACDLVNPKAPTVFSGPIMGTQYRISLACETSHSAEFWQQLALQEMDAVNQAMSTYIADSELSQFNRNNSIDWQTASLPLLQVIEIAQEVANQSAGAFDVTVSPLIELWGFGATKSQQINLLVPEESKLNELRKLIGHDKLEFEIEQTRWRKTLSGVKVDLSAVAKGYAVDQVSRALHAQGCHDHLVDIGGELKLAGHKNQQGDLWRVAVEKPLAGSAVNSIQDLLALTDMGVASSGDYRNFYQIDGKRYSHTIDPRTAKPIVHDLAAVTVLHKDTAYADAWATAFMVLGREAVTLADRLNIAAYFIFRDVNTATSATEIVAKVETDHEIYPENYQIVITKQFEKFRLSK